MHTPATQREFKKKLSFLARTTPETFKKLDENEKNLRKQLLPSITGKNSLTEDDRSLFALPLRMGGLDLLSIQGLFKKL